MRSHAKASSAGSNLGQTANFGRIRRAALANRGDLLDTDGGGAPKAKRVILASLLSAALVLLVLAVALAGAAAPAVVTGSASSVGQTTATLNGTVNPEGVELEECFFEFGQTTAYGQTAPCAESNASIGSGTSPISVHADLSGLELGAEYHFRLVAKNPDGTVQGLDAAFKLESPPVIRETWAQEVVFKEAVLKAKINPEGFATTYKFEWGPTAAYGNSTTESGVGSDKTDHVVSAFLDELQPGTTYHYRVIAINSIGTREGSDRVFTTHAQLLPAADCPNQLFRTGFAVNLPDCRGYEMVSPIDKNGGQISTFGSATNYRPVFNRSAPSGDTVTYSSHKPFANAPSGHYSNQYLATRGADGWLTHGIGAPQSTTIFDPEFAIFLELDTQFEMFTDDLSSAWLRDFNEVPLVPDGLEDYTNLYRQDTSSGAFEAVTNTEVIGFAPPSLGTEACCSSVEAQGISADGSHVVVGTVAKLTPDAPAGGAQRLYDYHDGELHLLSVLPNGTAYTGTSGLGSDYNQTLGGRRIESTRAHAVSDDGSRIFWTAPAPGGLGAEGFGDVYVRVNGETTVAVSDDGQSRFWTASPDGSKALFERGTSLASSALYVADVDSETATPIAGEIYGVLGASDNLGRVYFLSSEDLDSGATAGQRNLYLYDEGTIAFIATVSGIDTSEVSFPTVSGYNIGGPGISRHASRVTPDGRQAAFQSVRSLTGYDNIAENGEPATEVFVYDSETEQLICASCNPSGARPITQALRIPFRSDDAIATANGQGQRPAAAWLTTSGRANNTPRPLSDDGLRLVFNAFDALVPADTNGAQDVYQWEAEGSGTCHETGGCISLISTGQSPEKSEFIDASADGSDIFFETASSIDLEDPGLIDIYDARVGGGFPTPTQPPPCVGDACQSSPTPPNDPTPASAGFQGAGNPVARRDCNAAGRRAVRLSRHAKRLRRASRRASSTRQSKRLRTRSARLARKAKGASKRASRCRRANRRTQR